MKIKKYDSICDYEIKEYWDDSGLIKCERINKNSGVIMKTIYYIEGKSCTEAEYTKNKRRKKIDSINNPPI